jgi:phage/plasmid-associated DNA primase
MKTKEVCEDMDIIANFIYDECDTENKDATISSTKLFGHFQSYCIRNKYPSQSDKFFSKEMEKKSFEKKRGTKDGDRIMKYYGITISKDWNDCNAGNPMLTP